MVRCSPALGRQEVREKFVRLPSSASERVVHERAQGPAVGRVRQEETQVPSLNKLQLIGHLGKDPELRYAQSGNAVCNFTVAVDSGYGDKKKTVWWDVVVFKQLAENAKKYLAKGSLVYVEGETLEDEWDDKDTGEKRRKKKLLANELKFLDKKRGVEGQEEPPKQQVQRAPAPAEKEDEDGLPF